MKVTKTFKVAAITLSLSFAASSVFAAPSSFTTKNYTPYQSNAKIKNVWSPFPTEAGSKDNPTVRAVPWVGLKLLCRFASTCPAEIWMKTDTDNPVLVGEGTVDVSTGLVTPTEITNHGFTLTSSAPGVLELREVE